MAFSLGGVRQSCMYGPVVNMLIWRRKKIIILQIVQPSPLHLEPCLAWVRPNSEVSLQAAVRDALRVVRWCFLPRSAERE